MRRFALAVAVITSATAAHADYFDDTFATMMRIEKSAIVHVSGFDLPTGAHFQHALIGTYKHGEFTSTEMFLLRCNTKQCWGKLVWLGNGQIELLGLIDLAAPGALPTNRIEMPRERWYTSLDKKPVRRAWPALLVRTTESKSTTTKSYTMKDVSGTERRSELAILSLVKADAENPRILHAIVDWHFPTGSGRNVTFELVPGKGKALDLLATEQRDIDSELACIRPKPTQSRYLFDERRQYTQQLGPVTAGCH